MVSLIVIWLGIALATSLVLLMGRYIILAILFLCLFSLSISASTLTFDWHSVQDSGLKGGYPSLVPLGGSYKVITNTEPENIVSTDFFTRRQNVLFNASILTDGNGNEGLTRPQVQYFPYVGYLATFCIYAPKYDYAHNTYTVPALAYSSDGVHWQYLGRLSGIKHSDGGSLILGPNGQWYFYVGRGGGVYIYESYSLYGPWNLVSGNVFSGLLPGNVGIFPSCKKIDTTTYCWCTSQWPSKTFYQLSSTNGFNFKLDYTIPWNAYVKGPRIAEFYGDFYLAFPVWTGQYWEIFYTTKPGDIR